MGHDDSVKARGKNESADAAVCRRVGRAPCFSAGMQPARRMCPTGGVVYFTIMQRLTHSEELYSLALA